MQKEALLAKITKSMESRQGSGSQEIEPISDRRSAKVAPRRRNHVIHGQLQHADADAELP